MIRKLGIVSSNKVKKFDFIILEEKEGKLLNCREIGKVHRDNDEKIRKLNDVVYCIRRSNRHKNKVVHSDRSASFYEKRK